MRKSSAHICIVANQRNSFFKKFERDHREPGSATKDVEAEH